MRAAILIVLVFLVSGLFAGVASAQPAPAPARPPGAVVIQPPTAAAPQPSTAAPHDRDKTEGSGTGMALLFWVFAAIAVFGSIFVITRKNLIAAVMGMVGTFFGVAALYMMLYAHFLAVVQMLVYAGAIMVLFVFVIMILNKPEDEPWALTGMPGKVLAGIAMLYLTFRLGQTVWDVKVDPKALAAPPPVLLTETDPKTGVQVPAGSYAWGSTGAVGDDLFNEYLFPFEAISILLLVGVVGAIAVARPLKDDEPPQPDAEATS